MIAESIPFDLGILRGSVAAWGEGERSTGLHVTDIIRSLGEQVDPLPEAVMDAYAALGFSFERVMEIGVATACLSDRYVRIGELECDGISGSPDIVDTEAWEIVDTKVKWCSSKHVGEDGAPSSEIAAAMLGRFWKEVVQIKAYCYMLSKATGKPCITGNLWFCFVCGNWRGKPPFPQWKVRRLTFKPVELADNWNLLLAHAKETGMLQ